MSTTTPNKKPAIPAAARRTPTSSTVSANDNNASTTTNTTATKSTVAGINRTRSIRNGAPVSARAAAARKLVTPDSAAEEDAKAEMQAKVEELQQRLQESERACEDSKKQATVLQVKLDEALKEQTMLEETVHEHTERINDLENDKKESLRARREMEQIYESERAAAMKEKEEALSREEEMQNALQRMKETLAQREMRAGLDDERRPILSRHSSNARSPNRSPNPDGSDRQFAPPSISRSDSSSRSNSKLVMQ
jgi:chromosome segregation ATPase